MIYFFFQAEDGIRDVAVTGVQTCALPIFRADAFEELDWRVELELHPETRRWANTTGSNSSRSSRVSPVPRNRIGTWTARRSATTLPPLAVPSSLAITRPVSGTAAANASAWRTAFCPTV